jgi:hypothetical protein
LPLKNKKKLLKLACAVSQNRPWLRKLLGQAAVSQFVRKKWRGNRYKKPPDNNNFQAFVLIHELTMGQWSVQQQQGLLLAPELLEFRQVLTKEVWITVPILNLTQCGKTSGHPIEHARFYPREVGNFIHQQPNDASICAREQPADAS